MGIRFVMALATNTGAGLMIETCRRPGSGIVALFTRQAGSQMIVIFAAGLNIVVAAVTAGGDSFMNKVGWRPGDGGVTDIAITLGPDMAHRHACLFYAIVTVFTSTA